MSKSENAPTLVLRTYDDGFYLTGAGLPPATPVELEFIWPDSFEVHTQQQVPTDGTFDMRGGLPEASRHPGTSLVRMFSEPTEEEPRKLLASTSAEYEG